MLYIHVNQKNKIMFTIEMITDLSNDYVEDYLTTPELQQKFINQVFEYADGCCETDNELFCFIDGLLMNLYN
jgi:hypothetical protein